MEPSVKAAIAISILATILLNAFLATCPEPSVIRASVSSSAASGVW